MADVVVVDTPSAWDETTLAAVDASDSILAITGMDVPSVKNTAVMLSRLKQLGRLNGAVQVVLNRADSKVLIDEKEVEKALGHGVSVRVPSDRAVPRSVNKGVPIVIEAPRSAVAKALIGLSVGLSKNGE
jgi:pilus assembly protein CpaE